MKRIFSILSTLLVCTSLLTTPALAATELHPSSYLKEPSFVATRSGKDVVMQWMKKPNDQSYRLIVGHLATPKEPLDSKLISKYTERIDLRNNVGAVVYSVHYNHYNDLSKSSNISAQGIWIYSETVKNIRDEDFASVLITKSGTLQTYSLSLFEESVSSTSIRGIKQRAFKIACYVSAWGEPISKGVLSASNLSLSALSFLPGPAGKAATAGSQVINQVSLATNSTLLGAEEVVRGEINYQIDASKSDPSKLRPGNTIQIQLKNGQKRTATIKALSGAGKTTNLVLDIYVNVSEARSLFETIKTAKSSAMATNETCRQL
jgi:hypothetical protein